VDLERLRASGQNFASGLGKRTRYQLKRSIRLYEEAGPLSIVEATDRTTALGFLDELAALHQRHWRSRGLPGSFSNRFFFDFHRELVVRGLPENTIQLLRIAAGTTILGYIYNHVYCGHVWVYQTGFNYTNNGPYDRPGVVSHVLAIEHNLNKGHSLYDFSAGDAEYKRVLSNESVPLATLVMQAPRFKLRLEGAIRNLRRRLREKTAGPLVLQAAQLKPEEDGRGAQ
jgi:CelD/BcsL family acetyltransferase involved in cellulose biosynthesis